ncbi:MAG: protoporphyrinogen oxidase [Burkholderiales bacterium]|jgi:oxygen-dependent protoporphyrinogen oxidase|nr:protoporphyrinogen oxidase [Burkholderiales bacterium]
MNGTDTLDAIVAGAGISGLTLAWELHRAGYRVRVLEAASRTGGAIGTTREAGALVEAGPNSMLETSPLIAKLVGEVGLSGERVEANSAAKKRFILRDGRLIPVPTSPGAFFSTPLFSAGTKLALLREPFVARYAGAAEETVAGFVRRRLGPEFLDYAINPFVAGVYAGDPERLSVKAAFPRLADLEANYGSLIRGAILGARERKRNPEKSKQTAAMMSFREGMQSLTDAIAKRLPAVETNARVRAYRREPDGTFAVAVEGDGGARELHCRSLVLSLPADPTAELVAPHSRDAAEALREIPYPPVASVVMVFGRDRVAHPLDGFGFLVPGKEERRILGTIFSSTLFANRAPADRVVLTTFVGGTRQPEVALQDDAAMVATVKGELGQLIGVSGEPIAVRVSRWARAIPQYNLGHLDRVARVERLSGEQPGLFTCANWRGGISVGDCIKAAYATAERVGRFLGKA